MVVAPHAVLTVPPLLGLGSGDVRHPTVHSIIIAAGSGAAVGAGAGAAVGAGAGAVVGAGAGAVVGAGAGAGASSSDEHATSARLMAAASITKLIHLTAEKLAVMAGLRAIDALTGERLWRHDMDGDVTRPIQLSGDVLAAVSSDGNVNLIDAVNGRRRLTFRLWFGTSAAPTVSEGALIVPGDGANVQALDLSKRDVPVEKAVRYWWTKLWLWDMAPSPPLPRGYLWQQRNISGKTAYPVGADADSVYLGVAQIDGSGKVVALDLETGQTRWARDFKSVPIAPAILTPETLVIGVEGGQMFAVDKGKGDLLWEYEVAGGLATAPTITEDGVILVPTLDGKLLAMW